MQDFVSNFVAYTEGAISPEPFRLWAGISLLAGALERRVWVKNGVSIAYPNLYTLLVAPPGVGKAVIEIVKSLWNDTCESGTKIPAFHVSPDNMTKASLIDTMAKASTTFLGTGAAPLKYHSLLVTAEEFSVLLPTYDMEYIGILNSIFMNKDKYEESRRHGPAREVTITNPQLNILGGVQPSFLASLFPEEAWSTGLGRRLLMIYASVAPKQSLFFEPNVDPALRGLLLHQLGAVRSLYGQLKWTPEAVYEIDKWHMGGQLPVPDHSKLVSYTTSRPMFAIKLSMIASISRSHEMVIRLEDIDRGLGWMLEAERVMPDIFRAMIGKSDKDVIADLHLYVSARFLKSREPVAGDLMRRFLLERVPHEKVESIIGAAERALIIARIAGTQDSWVPKAKYGTGVE